MTRLMIIGKSMSTRKIDSINLQINLFTIVFIAFADSTDSLSFYDSLALHDSLSLPDSLNQVLEDSITINPLYLDSAGQVDSMKLDSTARMKHFSYIQPDYYRASPTSNYKSNFFVYPSQIYRIRVLSLIQQVSCSNKETIAGNESRIMVTMPLSEYVEKMIAEINKKI